MTSKGAGNPPNNPQDASNASHDIEDVPMVFEFQRESDSHLISLDSLKHVINLLTQSQFPDLERFAGFANSAGEYITVAVKVREIRNALHAGQDISAATKNTPAYRIAMLYQPVTVDPQYLAAEAIVAVGKKLLFPRQYPELPRQYPESQMGLTESELQAVHLGIQQSVFFANEDGNGILTTPDAKEHFLEKIKDFKYRVDRHKTPMQQIEDQSQVYAIQHMDLTKQLKAAQLQKDVSKITALSRQIRELPDPASFISKTILDIAYPAPPQVVHPSAYKTSMQEWFELVDNGRIVCVLPLDLLARFAAISYALYANAQGFEIDINQNSVSIPLVVYSLTDVGSTVETLRVSAAVSQLVHLVNYSRTNHVSPNKIGENDLIAMYVLAKIVRIGPGPQNEQAIKTFFTQRPKLSQLNTLVSQIISSKQKIAKNSQVIGMYEVAVQVLIDSMIKGAYTFF